MKPFLDESHPPDSPAPASPPFTAVTVATVFGLGFSPVAPGTLGSMVGVGLSLATLAWPIYAKLALLTAITLLGWWASEMVGRKWGHDHQRVVIDEVAGQYLTLLLIPGTFWWVLLGFVLFRLFDITKPQPARYFDNLKGGWYTMADDLVAGLYGFAAVTLLRAIL